MINGLLQKIIEGKNSYEMLPESWKINDIGGFSNDKKLFDYQLTALKYAIQTLHLYYEEYGDFEVEENEDVNLARKNKLYCRYLNDGDLKKEELDLKRLKMNEYLFQIYEDYFMQNEEIISFSNFVNRMSFWMATGSGKSLLIVKLFTIIDFLINNNEIPQNDILFLAPSDNLLEQLKSLVAEYNQNPGNIKKIDLVNLKEFDKKKGQNGKLMQQKFSFGDIRVFYYRSDNISDFGYDMDKEAKLNFRNYENDGQWYILLDEAHKGGKESSKRQAYFSIMARNGFMFNFSASFTDQYDLVTTVYDLRLKNFIMDGYGKNIYISKFNYESFKNTSEDFAEEEKQKIVLKSIITLTMLKIHSEQIKEIYKDAYHSPLMMTLVESVNKDNSDLEVFFREIEKIANNECEEELWLQAKNELAQEYSNNDIYTIGEGKLQIQVDILKKITLKDIMKYVFNSDSERGGQVEVIVSSDDKELAFRLKSATRTSSPFALIKIGDVGPWVKEKLKGYHFVGSFEDKNYFKNLNTSDDINILMGSRAFYEGWDSKRPNVINYINIGTSLDATKYITQSLGRGVRIEPIPNERIRIHRILQKIDVYIPKVIRDNRKYIELMGSPLETLFVFGTNKKVIEQIVNFDFEEEGELIDLKLLKSDDNRKLLIPTFKSGEYAFDRIPKFKIGLETLVSLYKYVNSMAYNVLLVMYNGNPMEIKLINRLIATGYNNIVEKGVEDQIFEIHDDYYYRYKDITRLYSKLINHIRFKDRLLHNFIPIEGNIRHFEHIRIHKVIYDSIQKKARKIYPRNKTSEIDIAQLFQDVQSKKITQQEFEKKLHERESSISQTIEESEKDLVIRYVPQHYYNPLIFSVKEDINYAKGIISVESEVKFLEALQEYTNRNDSYIKERFDWWKFSKINEHQDNIYIPYFDLNCLLKFKPDFIFWLCKGKSYRIVFVDPKSPDDRRWIAKIQGFKKLFEGKTFKIDDYEISLDLKLFYTGDFDAGLYNSYWTDNLESIFKK